MIIAKRQGYGAVTSGLTNAGGSISSSAKNASHDLSRGEIIAIIVAIVVVAILLIGSIWFCCNKTAKKRQNRHAKENQEANTTPLQASESFTSIPHVSPPKHSTTRITAPSAAASSYPSYPYPTRGFQSYSNDGSDEWKNEPIYDNRDENYTIDFNNRHHQQQAPPSYHGHVTHSSPLPTPMDERRPMYFAQ